jgi:hypothetical protein
MPRSRSAECTGPFGLPICPLSFRIGDYAGRCLNAPGFWRRVGTIVSVTRVPADHERGRADRLSGATPAIGRQCPSPHVSGRAAYPLRPRRWLRSTNRRSGLWEEVRNARLAGVRLR